MKHRSFETHRRGAWSVAFTALAAAALVWTPQSLAAQTGTIVGTVTEASSERPLESVQVFIEGTGVGTLTNNSGRYLLVNVPAGEHTVTAELVGYRSTSQTVTVQGGESAVADLQLSQQAVALDQIVVSGAGVATEKRRLGNTIATINTEGIENAPISNFSQLLQGREPSLVSLPSSGTTGEGSRIRIRGSASLSQSNEPIIYVDGIRIDNGGGFGEGVSAGGQGSPSRLDDIDPTSIERIEVLKGAAAATLYGTEASSGVIQIFTKRGQQGEPRWTLQTDQNVIQSIENRFIPHADFARNQQQVEDIRNAWGIDVQPFEPFEVGPISSEVFETGRSQTYSGSVQGGGELITYFASGRYQNENGVFTPNLRGTSLPLNDRNVRRQATTNLNIFPTDDLRIRVSGLYSETNLTTLNNSNNIFGFFSSMFMAQPRLAGGENGFFGAPAFGTTLEFAQVEVTQDNEHFAGSINANWAVPELGVPGQIVIDGTFGIDVTNTRSVEFGPFGLDVDNFTTSDTEGFRDLNDRNRREVTGDFKLNHEIDVTSRLTSSFVFGAQGFIRQVETSGGDGQNFPGPGLEVVGAAADESVFEVFLREVNTGIFFQEQFGWDDWAFLTVGGRWDKNSAFGESAGTEFYPKVSGSVVVSDWDSWPVQEWVSQFRVRAAVGQSGLQPGAFDQFTTFSSLSSAEGAGIQPDNLGNDELKPETSTEWEVGAEVGLFDGRAGFDFTYWDREVDDALVARQFPVTGGFRNTQLDNIGLVEARGIELSVNGTPYEGRNTEVRIFANASWIDEEVSDLGPAPPLKTGGSYPRYRNFIQEGVTPGQFIGSDIVGDDVPIPLNLLGDCSIPSREQALAFFSQPRNPSDFEVLSKTPDGGPSAPGCPGNFLGNNLGKPVPDWQGSFGADFTFLSNFELSTLFEYKFGNFKVQDLSGAFRQANAVIGRNTPGSNRVNAIMQNPASTPEQRLDAAIEWAREFRALAPMSGMNQIWDAAFLRFREMSLTYRVPSDFVDQFMLSNASVTFGVRNLWLFVNDQFRGLDPEVNVLGRCSGDDLDCQFLNSIEAWGVPIPRRYTFSLRVGF